MRERVEGEDATALNERPDRPNDICYARKSYYIKLAYFLVGGDSNVFKRLKYIMTRISIK